MGSKLMAGSAVTGGTFRGICTLALPAQEQVLCSRCSRPRPSDQAPPHLAAEDPSPLGLHPAQQTHIAVLQTLPEVKENSTQVSTNLATLLLLLLPSFHHQKHFLSTGLGLDLCWG